MTTHGYHSTFNQNQIQRYKAQDSISPGLSFAESINAIEPEKKSCKEDVGEEWKQRVAQLFRDSLRNVEIPNVPWLEAMQNKLLETTPEKQMREPLIITPGKVKIAKQQLKADRAVAKVAKAKAKAKAKASFKVNTKKDVGFLSHEDFNIPSELHPSDPDRKGKFSYTVASPFGTGAAIEVQLRSRAYYVKKLGSHIGADSHVLQHWSWSKFNNCPVECWRKLSGDCGWSA